MYSQFNEDFRRDIDHSKRFVDQSHDESQQDWLHSLSSVCSTQLIVSSLDSSLAFFSDSIKCVDNIATDMRFLISIFSRQNLCRDFLVDEFFDSDLDFLLSRSLFEVARRQSFDRAVENYHISRSIRLEDIEVFEQFLVWFFVVNVEQRKISSY